MKLLLNLILGALLCLQIDGQSYYEVSTIAPDVVFEKSTSKFTTLPFTTSNDFTTENPFLTTTHEISTDTSTATQVPSTTTTVFPISTTTQEPTPDKPKFGFGEFIVGIVVGIVLTLIVIAIANCFRNRTPRGYEEV